MKILYKEVRSYATRLVNFKSSLIHQFKASLLLLVSTFFLNNGVKAQAGHSLDFDGSTSNYVSIANFLPSGSYTKEAWIRARSFAAFSNNIISGSTVALWAPNGNLSSGHNFNYFTVSDPAPLNLNQWYHVAVTYDGGTNTMILYKDGVAVSTGNPVGVYSETVQYIGAYNDGSNIAYLWDGQIDEVRLWNVVRTPAQIAASANCLLTRDEFGLLAYYDFEQGIASGANPTEITLFNRADRCFLQDGTLIGFGLSAGTSNWVADASPAAGSCGGTFQNINVTGNGFCINDGDNVVSALDHTDFGTTTTTRTYTIQNTGTADLTISGITFTGANASEFSVTTPPAATVTAGNSTTFVVTFTAAGSGVKFATVNIANDDPDELTYDFSISAAFFTLPVNLKSFAVKKAGVLRSQLSWTTSSESNNRGFDIQRSRDGLNWTSIGFVAGAGTSALEQSYQFTDLNPAKGANYYRLNQIDFDNKSKISEVKSVVFASDKTLVYPVPATDLVTIELPDNRLVGSIAYLTDMQGKLVRQVTISSMQQPVSLSGLQAGMYWMKLADGATHKLIKQ